MKINAVKMHGIGNSYIVLKDLQRSMEDSYSKLAIRLSDKNSEMRGSDGIIIVNKGNIAPYRMRILNPDGSEAEMCGNGIRILARYLHDRELTGKSARIEVGGKEGGRTVKTDIKGKMIKVEMGVAHVLRRENVEVSGRSFYGTSVSVGNPHCVIFSESSIDAKSGAAKYGKEIENHPLFAPARTNVEFAYVRNRGEVVLHVWERGAGITLACGTGACASAFAAFEKGSAHSEVKVFLPGGQLQIQVCRGDEIKMTGPAEYIASAQISLDKLLV